METEKNLHASIPETLLAKAEKVAAAQHLTMDELTHVAMMHYLEQLGGTQIYPYGQPQGRKLGIKLEGIERIVHETAASYTARVQYDPDALTPEEWVRELREWTHRHDGSNLPILSDEAMSREAIYEDRGL